MLEHRGRAGTEGFRPALLCLWLWLWLWVGLVFRAPFDPAVGPGCFPCSRVVSVGPGCLMRSWAGLLGAPVGGGPPARSPHASLTARSGRSRSPARPRRSQAFRSRCRLRPPQPGPAAAYGRRSQALRFRRRLRPPQPGPVSKPGQAPPAATLNISAYNLRQHFLFYPQCAK